MSRFARSFALCLALLWPTLAAADARIEARRHFRVGMAQIAEGRFEEGIAELERAYAIMPHPNVLFNIARAHADQGDDEAAVKHYRRYLASGPKDAAAVAERVLALEARIAAATPAEVPPPPPAASEDVRPALAADRRADGLDPRALARLAELAERLEGALARAEALSGAPAPASSGSSGQADPPPELGLLPAGSPDSVPYEEQVVSASKRAQATLEAPNAMAVITGEQIRMSGATSLVELLRRVPGAEVMAMGVGSANVSLRGFNQRIANKVLVLLDGRTEYQDFLGLTIWSAIPVGLDEIERIEVIRGPGSALYGANAMLGVVNIITRTPGTGPKTQLAALGGSGDTAGFSLLSSGADGPLRYRASAAFSRTDKWSRDFGDDRQDVRPRVADTGLGLSSTRANLTATYALSPGAALGVSGGVNRVYTEIYPLGLLRNYYFDGLTAYAKADLTTGPLHFKAFWNHLSGQAGPQYSAIGESWADTEVTSDVLNAEVVWDHVFDLAGRHHLAAGLEGRFKNVTWDYLGSTRREIHAAAFVQNEWRILDPLRVLASYRVDRHPLLDEGEPGLAHSPRASAVWRLAPDHALRLGWATAFREPTFLESYTNIQIPVPGVPGASVSSVGNTLLRPEQLTSVELGWRGEAGGLGLEWDVALYRNDVRDLINVSAVERLAAGEEFDPASGTYLLGRSTFRNEPGVYTAHGVELGARYSPLDGLSLVGSAAAQSVTASQLPEGVACAPCTQAPAFKLFGGAGYRTPVGFEFSADVAWTSETTWISREPSALDPTVVQYLADPLSDYLVINARIAYRLPGDRVTVALIGTNVGPGHAQHPLGNRIDRRVFATLTVTP